MNSQHIEHLAFFSGLASAGGIPLPELMSDSDGVLFDFEGGFAQRFGVKWEETPNSEAWKMIYRTPDFYEHLPLYPWARDYWEAISPLNPTVLSGAPAAGFDAAASAKRRAWAREFGDDVKVIVCKSKDKPRHMGQAGSLLIDDSQSMIDSWSSAGGVGILFRDIDSALDALRLTLSQLRN